MQVADLRSMPIFEGLTDSQLAELVAGGTEVSVVPGVDLFEDRGTLRVAECAMTWKVRKRTCSASP